MRYELGHADARSLAKTLQWIGSEAGSRLMPPPLEFNSREEVDAYERDLRNLGEASTRAVSIFRSSVRAVDPPKPDPPAPPPPPPPPPPPTTGVTVDPEALREHVATTPPERKVHNGSWGDAPAWFTASTYAHSVLTVGGHGGGGIQTRFKPRTYLRGSWLEGASGNKWLAQVYGPIGLWESNFFFGDHSEHALYNKSIWGGHWRHCYVKDMHGQVIQAVMRWPHEVVPEIPRTAIYDPFGTGVAADWLLEECVFIDNAPAGGRKSYYLSFFESTDDISGNRTRLPGRTLQDIRLVGCHMEATEQPEAHGALMVHGQRHVVIDATKIFYKNPNRSVIQVWGCDSLTIRGGELGMSGSVAELDIRGVDRVRMEGVGGNWLARVYRSSLPWYQWHHLEAHLEAVKSNEDFDVVVA